MMISRMHSKCTNTYAATAAYSTISEYILLPTAVAILVLATACIHGSNTMHKDDKVNIVLVNNLSQYDVKYKAAHSHPWLNISGEIVIGFS